MRKEGLIIGIFILVLLLNGCSSEKIPIKDIKENFLTYIQDTHTYTICKQKSWNGIQKVRILGTDTYIDKEPMRAQDLKLHPECGSGSDEDLCYECWYHTDIEEPIFEIQLQKGAKEVRVCDTLVRNYYIDGVNKKCTDSQWNYINHNAYFPYNKNKFKTISQCESFDGTWHGFSDNCADSCDKMRNNIKECSNKKTMGCDCGEDKCWNGNICESNKPLNITFSECENIQDQIKKVECYTNICNSIEDEFERMRCYGIL